MYLFWSESEFMALAFDSPKPGPICSKCLRVQLCAFGDSLFCVYGHLCIYTGKWTITRLCMLFHIFTLPCCSTLRLCVSYKQNRIFLLDVGLYGTNQGINQFLCEEIILTYQANVRSRCDFSTRLTLSAGSAASQWHIVGIGCTC